MRKRDREGKMCFIMKKLKQKHDEKKNKYNSQMYRIFWKRCLIYYSIVYVYFEVLNSMSTLLKLQSINEKTANKE